MRYFFRIILYLTIGCLPTFQALAYDNDYNTKDGPARLTEGNLMPPAASNSWSANTQSLPSVTLNRHRGFFVTGIVGVNVLHTKVIKKDVLRDSEEAWHGFAWNTGMGYFFNNYVAIEANFSRQMSGVYTVDTALRGVIPIHSRWSIFAKVGLSSVFTSYISGSLILADFGFGADYAFTPNLSMTAAVTGLSFGSAIGSYNGSADLGLIGLGLSYYFI